MNTKIILSFVLGGVIGAASTFYFLNKKFEDDLNREVEEYKKIIENTKEETDKDSEKEEKNNEKKEEVKATKDIVHDLAAELKYDQTSNKIQKNDKDNDYPFLIDESEMGIIDGYKISSYTYYTVDGILADAYDDVIYEEDYLIGSDAMNELEKGEENVIYVQNNKLKRYFEVLIDNTNPYPYAT